MNQELELIIQAYEVALQAAEVAIMEAQFGENCGMNGDYFTSQELSEMVSRKKSEKAREMAISAGIKLPSEEDYYFNKIKRSYCNLEGIPYNELYKKWNISPKTVST